ncbi:MAG: aromatic amino acid transporter [Cardiobacteriaceae bacterium]|nr:aromatic amino acid transporter [Cardiobacteriaceae bacterium]
MNKQPSVIGGACIIAGVCVGAGMLALPISGAGAWTLWSAAVLILTMACMTLSGWMLLESYKHYPDLRVSFNTVTKDVLGPVANIINNLSVYFVGGILLYAYITVAGDILNGVLGLNARVGSILFALIFGAFVWHSTRAVDRISVLLIVFMVLSFAFSIFGLTANIKLDVLFDRLNPNGEYLPYTMMLLPVALTSFGYHHSVASMRAYYGEEKKASRAILFGMLIALALYLLWITSIFGNLPRDQFGPVLTTDKDQLGVLLSTLGNVIDSGNVQKSINAFSWAAILSSFIGVGLGVFDYLADLFKIGNTPAERGKTWALTFLPPLVFSLAFPFGFVYAIGYAGAVATIWACIIPALLAWKIRKTHDNAGFKAPGGNAMVFLVIVFGIATAAFHFLSMAGVLPVFKG